MKKRTVLIITSNRTDDSIDWQKRQAYIREFYAGVEKYADDVKIHYTTYNDITLSVIDGVVTCHDTRHDLDLKSCALVHFKNSTFDYEQAATIAYFLDKAGVLFFNKEVCTSVAWGKIAQMVRLSYGGVTVPDTYFARTAVLRDLIDKDALPIQFQYPIIMKADDASKGRDNYLVKDKAQALAILDDNHEKSFVVQPFIPNDGDYRFLYAGTDASPLVFLRQSNGDTHLNNTSQGGSGTFVEYEDVPNEYYIQARQAAMILQRDISGVDILVDKVTKKAYVLEVNSTPAFATGYGIERKTKHFADMLNRVFELQEEEEE